MEIFFISDTHFGHQNVLKYCPKRLEFLTTDDVQKMDELLVKNWNDRVSPFDTVYHLGDVIFAKTTFDVLDRLNGTIHLIEGNHDSRLVNKPAFSKKFKSISKYDELNIDKETTICMFHYPIEQWNKKHYGAIHLHGHCHGTLDTVLPRRYDVGVDCTEMCPISLDEILARAKNDPVEILPQRN